MPTEAWFSQTGPRFPHKLWSSTVLVTWEMAWWLCGNGAPSHPGCLLRLQACCWNSGDVDPRRSKAALAHPSSPHEQEGLFPQFSGWDFSSLLRGGFPPRSLPPVDTSVTTASPHPALSCKVQFPVQCGACLVVVSPLSHRGAVRVGEGWGPTSLVTSWNPRTQHMAWKLGEPPGIFCFCLVWGFSLSQSLLFVQVALWIHGSLKYILYGLYSNQLQTLFFF